MQQPPPTGSRELQWPHGGWECGATLLQPALCPWQKAVHWSLPSGESPTIFSLWVSAHWHAERGEADEVMVLGTYNPVVGLRHHKTSACHWVGIMLLTSQTGLLASGMDLNGPVFCFSLMSSWDCYPHENATISQAAALAMEILCLSLSPANQFHPRSKPGMVIASLLIGILNVLLLMQGGTPCCSPHCILWSRMSSSSSQESIFRRLERREEAGTKWELCLESRHYYLPASYSFSGQITN